MKKVLFALALVALVACGKDGGGKKSVESVMLDRSMMMLGERVMSHLHVTVKPSKADAEVEWSSDNPSVAMVNPAGVVSGESCGETYIRVKAGDKEDRCKVVVCQMPEAVDLGLGGVKWASKNIGISSAETSNGEAFTWASIVPKSMNPNPPTPYFTRVEIDGVYKERVSKYCQNAEYGLNGYTDNLSVLQGEDDPATQILGSGWRTPTQNEFFQLTQNCNWFWDESNKAFKIVNRSDANKMIYLPITGNPEPAYDQEEGYYWTATLQGQHPTSAYWFEIKHVHPTDANYDLHTVVDGKRYALKYIRAVRED